MVGNDKEYICDPAPRSSNRLLMPVLGPNMLKQDFLDPDAIATGQKTFFDQLPKRRSPGLLAAIPGGDVTYWGLYIEKTLYSSGHGIANHWGLCIEEKLYSSRRGIAIAMSMIIVVGVAILIIVLVIKAQTGL